MASGLIGWVSIAYTIRAVLFTVLQTITIDLTLLGPASESLARVFFEATNKRHAIGFILVAVVAGKTDAIANAVPASESLFARFLC